MGEGGRGTLLATGCQDGAAALWDFDTRGVIKVLQDKKPQEIPAAIASIGWRGTWTSASLGCNVLANSRYLRRCFHAIPVLSLHNGQINPSNSSEVLACPNCGVPTLINIENELQRVLPGSHVAEPQVGTNARKGAGEAIRNYAASFSPAGTEVFVGNGKGMVTIWRVEDLEQLTRDGSYFLVSETGKIRVNRTQWRKCCFSSDGNYVLGATAEKGEHTIHIWYRENGQLVHVLEGPKESVWDLAWHPTRTIIASCGQSGKVYIWAKQYSENYSAFAPNFKELEENEEYIEREDEFDLIDHHQIIKKKRVVLCQFVVLTSETSIKEEEEAVEVDITTLDESTAQSYGLSEIPNELVYLPAIPDPDPQAVAVMDDDPTPSAQIKTRVFKNGLEVEVLHAKRLAESIGLAEPIAIRTGNAVNVCMATSLS
eukprot:767594-Hanusia_phi.AAC.24